jgi:hypothetical protein
MLHRHLPLIGVLVSLVACTQATPIDSTTSPSISPSAIAPSPTPPSQPGRDLTPLFSHIWRVTTAPTTPASGSINIFLANGTMLNGSCVETYGIFPWTIDKAQPNILRVVENNQLAYTAEILELTNSTLKLKKNLVRSNETQEVTLTAIEQEFV